MNLLHSFDVNSKVSVPVFLFIYYCLRRRKKPNSTSSSHNDVSRYFHQAKRPSTLPESLPTYGTGRCLRHQVLLRRV